VDQAGTESLEKNGVSGDEEGLREIQGIIKSLSALGEKRGREISIHHASRKTP